jgi:hypothetical protein
LPLPTPVLKSTGSTDRHGPDERHEGRYRQESDTNDRDQLVQVQCALRFGSFTYEQVAGSGFTSPEATRAS